MKHPTRTILALCLLAGGCEQVKRIDETDGGTDCEVPDEVQRIFTESCAVPSCHSGDQTPNLTAGQAASIIGQTATQVSLPLVEIGNVSGSYLAIKIQPDLPDSIMRGGDLMPQPPEELSEADRALLLGWIAGAELACEGGAGDTGGTGTSGSETGSTTGPTTYDCSIEGLVPGAADPIDAGMDAGQIPPDIAEALADNCGCHFVDGFEMPPTDYPFDDLNMETLDGFTAMLDNGKILRESAIERLAEDSVLPMPPVGCEEISQAQRDLLLSWLEAGVPDGATWMP
jgi:hypothetical protein